MTSAGAFGRPTLLARPDPRAVGAALVIASACGFGSGALFAKPIYAAGVDWLTLLFWRFLIAAAISWAWLLLLPGNRASLRVLTRRRILVLLALGTFYVGNTATYYASLETVPASLDALIVYVYPALVAVLSLRFGRRLRGRRAWTALALSMAGVVLAVGGIPSASGPPAFGLLLAVSAPVIYAVWIVLAARLGGERTDRELARDRSAGASAEGSSPHDPVAATSIDVGPPGDRRARAAAGVPALDHARPAPGAGTPAADQDRAEPDAAVLADSNPRVGREDTVGATIPPTDAETTVHPSHTDPAPAAALMMTATAVVYLALMLGTRHSISPATVPGEAWSGLLGVAVFSTALAVQAFYAGARRVGAARASIISTIEPIYTIALAALLLGESLAPVQILGGALIIGGVLLAESSPDGPRTEARRSAPTAAIVPVEAAGP